MRAVRPRFFSSASRASAKRDCWPSLPLARTPGGTSSRRLGVGARARLPFSVFVDALDEYVRGMERSRLAALDDDVRTELAHVFPSLAALATEGEVALQDERYRSHRAVRALLEQLAWLQPLVLMLDDLHWADSASVELLGALLRRPPTAPVLLALAERPRQVPERLSAALERAHRTETLPASSSARSAPTTRDGYSATQSTAPTQPCSTRRAAGTRSISNSSPARSTAWLGGRCPRRDVPGGDRGSGHRRRCTHRRARAAVRLCTSRPGRSGGGRRSVRARAGSGRTRMPETSVMEAVDELIQLDLLRTTDMPRRFRFRHPLVRRAVYDATSGGRRLVPTSAAPRRSRRGELRLRRAPITSSARHARATSPPRPSCARPARKPCGSRRQAPRTGSRRHCACSRRPRWWRSASSFSSHARGR